MEYSVSKAVEYAHKWAYSRNPKYYDFENIGGDCTNFVSQCLYAGCGIMNHTPDLGWYYISPSSRSAAWSGVEYLYKFLVSNKCDGPYGHEAPLHTARRGDIIQLSFDGRRFSHSLFIVDIGKSPNPEGILIATHSYDADNRPLNTYTYKKHRLIVIDGVRGRGGKK